MILIDIDIWFGDWTTENPIWTTIMPEMSDTYTITQLQQIKWPISISMGLLPDT